MDLTDDNSSAFGDSWGLGRGSVFSGGLSWWWWRLELVLGACNHSNADQVLLSELVLRIPCVEFDGALDLIERVHVNGERLLGHEEGQSLGARRRCQRSGILEEVGGLDMVDKGREVKAALDRGLGSRCRDRGNMGLEARKNRVGGLSRELEEGGDNGDIVWIRC